MKRTLNSITLLILLALLPFSGCASTRDRLQALRQGSQADNGVNVPGNVPDVLQGLSYASMNDWNFRR
jgi:hypothetical protein